ncbi:MAG: hypothetical protein RL670_30 [Actinomycetota bacterium]
MSQKEPAGIDPRGPRFGASITSFLLLVTVFLGLGDQTQLAAFYLLVFIAALFGIGALLGTARHPYGIVFKAFIRPRLKAPTELEDPRPPKFAQSVGLLVSLVGIILALLGVQYAVAIFAAFAFVAAFLNAAFAYCLGCQIYLLLKRAGIIRQAA